MALSDKELNRLKNLIGERDNPNLSGMDKGYSFKEFGQDIAQTGRGVLNTVKNTAQKQEDAFFADQPLSSKLTQSIGIGAGGVSSIIGETLKGAVKVALPQAGEESLKSGIQSAVEPIAQSQPIQSLIQKYESLDENTKRDVDSLLGIGSFAADVIGLGLTTKGIKASTQVAKEGAQVITEGLSKATQAVSKTTNAITTPFKGLAQIPSNIATNVAERQATELAIKQLPSKVAQNSVRQGVDLSDANKVLKIPTEQKTPLAKLYDLTKRFVADETKTNPLDAVGAPVVKRLKLLQSQTDVLGKKLNSTVKNLKFQSVKKLEELGVKFDETLSNQGITFSNGKLNLKGSQLEGLGGNETIIQNVYRRFVNAKDASDLHRLKKYIDDNVEFGKTSQGLTGNAEALLKGWRKSIDDTLDGQFPVYKKLNDEYRVRISPLNDMKKLMKNISGVDEDLLNIKAGLLAKRLASNTLSNPQIRQILRNLDKATKIKGKVSLNIENLVDFYGTLEKYFPEIVGKNTFQGQITTGIENVKGIKDAIGQSLDGLVGQTDAVRRKAIIDLLDDFFSKK